MSSGSYTARHRAPGRHRTPHKRSLPRALSAQFILPTAAAATLVLTTTGASMAGSAPLELQTSSIDVALAQSQVSESRDDTVALAERRTATTGQAALLQGRQQEADRIARDQEREALAQKQAEEAKAKAEEEARQAAQRWVMPMSGYRYTSGYGSRWGRLHAGIDLAAPVGTPIFAVSSGTVIKAAYTGACGNNVWVKHWEGSVTRYCHMDYMSVSVGQRVAPGQKLGGNGNTGRSYGPHLHFEVRPGGENADPVDPIGWLRSKGLGL